MWGRVGRDSAIFAGAALVMVVFQAAFRLLAIHDLSIDSYGRAALLLSVFNFALVFANFGIPAAAARLAARSTGRTRGLDVLLSVTKVSVIPSLGAGFALGLTTYVLTSSIGLAVVCALGVFPMVMSGVYAGFIRGRGFVWSSASVQPANVVAQLLALLAISAAGVSVGVGWVLITFCIGNVAAFVLSLAYVAWWMRSEHGPDSPPDPQVGARRVLSFSAWLALANAAVIALALIPRVALVHLSYGDVASFDLALLVYSIPQRLTASLVIALVPTAAARQVAGRRITLPTATDAVVLMAAFLVCDALLWWTHALSRVLNAVGLSHYAGAEPFLLILLLAAPAELFFSMDAAVLQAFGRSRSLASLVLTVLGLSTAAALVAVQFGPNWLALILAADYWVLFLASRRLTPPEVTRRSIFSRFFPTPSGAVQLESGSAKAE
jgi:O-antigen/teichoic acid export membrane protein